MNRSRAHKRLTTMVFCALLIAIQIILVRFCSIQTPFQRISLGFVPMSMAGILFGPVYSCIVAALADLLGAILFPTGGAFWPGFTIVAALTGLTYGLLYQRPGARWSNVQWLIRLGVAVTVVNLFVNLVLGTLNLYFMYGAGAFAQIPTRAIKVLVMIPIEFAVIFTLNKILAEPLKRQIQK